MRMTRQSTTDGALELVVINYFLSLTGTAHSTGGIPMFKMLRRVPVKSRLPVEAWLIAAAVTLYSLVSSQLHLPDPAALQAAGPTATHLASLSR